jgi:glycosyltransferase involved in cell wall biosynthesis
MKVLFLMNHYVEYDWEQWKKKGQTDSPKHHLWGITHLQKYDIHVEVLPYEKYKFLKKLGYQLRLGDLDQQLRALFSQSQYDLIYSGCQTSTIILSLLRSLGLFRKPILVKLERPFRVNFWSKIFVKLFASGHDRLLCLSSRVKNQLRDEFGIPESKLPLLNWGADCSDYEIKNSDRNPEIILTAGGTSRDYNTLVKAFAEVNYPLQIYCTGKSAPTVSEIPANITCRYNDETEKNAVSFQDLLAEYERAYAIAIPLEVPANRADTTTLIGLTSLLEAMAMGKAVIMTKHRQVNIDVEKEGIGLWVEPGDVKGWQKAISYLLEHPNETKQMGKRARELCEKTYNLEVFSSQLAEEITRVLVEQKQHLQEQVSKVNFTSNQKV